MRPLLQAGLVAAAAVLVLAGARSPVPSGPIRAQVSPSGVEGGLATALFNSSGASIQPEPNSVQPERSRGRPSPTLRNAPSAPRVALLATPVGGDVTELYFQRPGDAELSSPMARFRHAPDATVKGTTLPGTKTVLVVAGIVSARDPSWASALFRLEPGQEATLLADRVYVSSRPLVTATGRVYVQRGRAGADPSPEEALAGRLREDALNVDEVDISTGRSRTVYATSGYLAFLAGTLGDELFVYRVAFQQAELVAVNSNTEAVRTLASPMPPFARDFSVDAARGALLYTELDERTGTWAVERLDLATLRRETLARGPSMALAPHSWPGASFAFNPDGAEGLHVPGSAVAPAPFGLGVDFVQAVSRDEAWLCGLHTLPSRLSIPFVLSAAIGAPVPLAFPAGARVDLAGFVEDGAR